MKMDTTELVGFGRFISVLILSFGFEYASSSRDLALNKKATQSSTYNDGPHYYVASRAVDGVLGRDTVGGQCSHTGAGHNKAWWKVDLGQIYRIQMINITYRYSQTVRLKGYSLYVTNETDMTHADGSISKPSGHLCYHDTELGTPTYNQSRQCHVSGRYVVFYNTRQHEGAYVELCGVQVYGCGAGKFGFNCGDTCHCATGGCNPDTGECDVRGCQTGWMGLSCSLRCHCKSGGACNIDTGACIGGCQTGWSGSSCFVGPRDLAHNKPTRQSSTNGGDTSRFGSGKAVDGIITADVTFRGSCSLTDPSGNHPNAYWQVDLEKVERIHTINIVYRQLYSFRMSGFYLYISNSSYTNPQSLSRDYLCYHDHGPGLPSYIQSIPCHVNGRYVIFYNKRPADYEPRNVTYYSETTAVIELCEVQVLGDCEHGTYGQDCSLNCHCATSDCNKQTGRCGPQGCAAGWTGTTCSQACDNGTFGQHCSQRCHCLKPDCDKQTGRCTGGCLAGWQGDSCNQACSYEKFGQDCSQNCHCFASDCNKETGMCGPPGCSAGWKGTTCSQACSNGTYGQDCSLNCHCATSDCNKQTGRCGPQGCKAGWKGTTCSQECVNSTFGRDCKQTCHCARSGCDRVSGVCIIPGCTEDWHGDTCSQAQISQNQSEVIGCHDNLANTEVVTGYAILGTLLAIAIFYNIGLTLFCLRKFRRIKTPTKSSTDHEMQSNSVSQDNSDYEGLDITKVDSVKNIYDSIGK